MNSIDYEHHEVKWAILSILIDKGRGIKHAMTQKKCILTQMSYVE